jgi:hypothetical protein
MNVAKILIIIGFLFILINLIGWLTKPDNYKSPQNYRGSLSPMQPYAQHADPWIIATSQMKS